MCSGVLQCHTTLLLFFSLNGGGYWKGRRCILGQSCGCNRLDWRAFSVTEKITFAKAAEQPLAELSCNKENHPI